MRILILLFIISNIALSKDILLIGDSHTAGPFGKLLHKKLTASHNIVTLGHASSAAIHWMSDTNYKLSGGVFNEMHLNGRDFNNPHSTHWREKVIVPKFKALLKNASYHIEWGQVFRPELIIIALGANDARSISDEQGRVRESEYKRRQSAITAMLDAIKVPCLWIGPPNGIKKPQANQKTLYKYLEEAIIGRCEFLSSNHYMVRGCDGVHMNCSSEMHNAKSWVAESYKFIQNNL